MSQYIDESTAGTQLLPTTRAAFITIVIAAWIATTSGLISIAWEFDPFDESGHTIGIAWLLLLLPMAAFALFGAVTGAVIALLSGATLSRQFCWILSLACGIAALPVMFSVLGRTLAALPSAMSLWIANAPRSSMGLGIALVPITLLMGLVAGIVMGVLLTRRRLGLGRQARRAARVVSICTVPLAVGLEILWRLTRDRSVRVPYDEVIAELLLLTMAVVTAAAMAALICAERRRIVGARFEVLPLQSPTSRD